MIITYYNHTILQLLQLELITPTSKYSNNYNILFVTTRTDNSN